MESPRREDASLQPSAAAGRMREERGAFCMHCGEGIAASDRFCVACGEKTRSSEGFTALQSARTGPSASSPSRWHQTVVPQEGPKTPHAQILLAVAAAAVLSVVGVIGLSDMDASKTTAPTPRLAMSGRVAAPAHALKEYRYPRDGFAIELPAAPKRVVTYESVDGRSSASIQYQLERSGIPGAYMVMIAEVPEDSQAPMVNLSTLRAVRDEAIAAMPGCTLLCDEPVTVSGHEGLESALRSRQGAITHLMVFAQGRLYQVFVGRRGSGATRKVIGSFRLLDDTSSDWRGR